MMKIFGSTNFFVCCRVVITPLLIIIGFDTVAQHSVHPCLHGMVQVDRVREDLSALTAPMMEGRGTGQPGYQRAAAFVAEQLKSFNLVPVHRNQEDAHAFFHPVPYLRVVPTGGEFELGGRKWRLGQDFVPTNRKRQDTTNIAIAMGDKQLFYCPARFGALKKQWAEEERHRPRIRLLEAKRESVSSNPSGSKVSAPKMQEYAVSRALYRSIKKKAASLDQATGPNSVSVVIQSKRDTFSAPNVVGMIRGKSRPNEYIFLTAHLDHLGVVDGQIHPGADDNGSGSAVLLSVARALSQLSTQQIHPERSIVLVWFSGEENGLLGSRWMANTLADSLEIRSDQVFANINMDMLGRHDQVHGPDEPYLYVVHHHENQSIRPFTEQVNTLCGDLQLDFSYSRADDPERLFMRSDHYAFHQLGIPAFFLFSGLHEDYHKPTDTADKISVARLARNAGFVLNLAWQLAQRPERLDPVEP
ncbi:MAG: M28 family metallopeptidase [Bacteroidia bacterium]|jgi:hypothetical protein